MSTFTLSRCGEAVVAGCLNVECVTHKKPLHVIIQITGDHPAVLSLPAVSAINSAPDRPGHITG